VIPNEPAPLWQSADIEAAINEALLPLASDRAAATIPSDRFCM
jgi:hypothetical protein